VEAPTPAEDDAAWGELDGRQVRCWHAASDAAMVEEIEAAAKDKDTLGGELEIVAWGLPPGIGGYVTNEERLDGRLARAALSVHAMKSFSIGEAATTTRQRGSAAHDEMFPASEGDDQGMGVTRRTNRAGGVEGGMTNGAPLVVRVGMKPLPTLMRPLATVDLASSEAATAHAERSDTCAIAAAAVALETAIAFELARVLREQFGSQALVDVVDAFARYRDRVRFPVRAAIQLA
jgi:chorismate synthase